MSGHDCEPNFPGTILPMPPPQPRASSRSWYGFVATSFPSNARTARGGNGPFSVHVRIGSGSSAASGRLAQMPLTGVAGGIRCSFPLGMTQFLVSHQSSSC